MTLEEIKSALIAEQDECDTVDSWGLGKYVGIQMALNMLDTLEPSWHPYPQEKPTEGGAYLITRYTKEGGIFVDIDAWIPQYEMFDSTEDIPSSMKVLAWMELPKPYKEAIE